MKLMNPKVTIQTINKIDEPMVKEKRNVIDENSKLLARNPT